MSKIKVTKKELRNVLRDARSEHPFGWRLCEVYAFIENNKVEYFTHYHGQGLYEPLIKGVPACTTLTDYTNKLEFNLNDAVDLAFDSVTDMIEDYIDFMEEVE